MTLTLKRLDPAERIRYEAEIADQLSDVSIWLTPIGGVGVWPAMVQATDRAVIAFEITAHEWAHHYLIFYPLGLEYFSRPETRIINESTATLFGDEIGNKVIERFYADELAAGLVQLRPIPDYRALLAAIEGQTVQIGELERSGGAPFQQNDYAQLRAIRRGQADYLLSINRPEAAQLVLDQTIRHAQRLNLSAPSEPNSRRPDQDRGGWIHHTRVSADYLLSLGRVDAAELTMQNGAIHSGQRVLNQAWFAFNAGYQSNPTVERQPDGASVIRTTGGGGDPIGAAIYEIRARAGSSLAFMQIMRGITTREALFAALDDLRARE